MNIPRIIFLSLLLVFGHTSLQYGQTVSKSWQQTIKAYCNSVTIIVDTNALGQMNGPFLMLGPEGNIKVKGSYANGQRVGVWEYIQNSGIKELELTFANDTMNGPVSMWYSSGVNAGQIKVEGHFSSGVFVDTVYNYFDSKKRLIRCYRDGIIEYAAFKQEDGTWNTGFKAMTHANEMDVLDKEYLERHEEALIECLANGKRMTQDEDTVKKHSKMTNRKKFEGPFCVIGAEVGFVRDLRFRFYTMEYPFPMPNHPRWRLTFPFGSFAMSRVDTAAGFDKYSFNMLPVLVASIPVGIGYLAGIDNKVYDVISLGLAGCALAPHALTNAGVSVALVPKVLELKLFQRTDYYLAKRKLTIYTETRAGLRVRIREVGFGLYGAIPETKGYFTRKEPYVSLELAWCIGY